MVRFPVSSSNLRSIGYSDGTLEIEFNSGGIYQYRGVPESAYMSLMSASSKGTCFHNFIKDRYPTVKIR